MYGLSLVPFLYKAAACLALLSLFMAARTDAHDHIVPDRLTALFLVSGALLSLFQPVDGSRSTLFMVEPIPALMGALALTLPLLVICMSTQGFGGADVKWCFALALQLGWLRALWILFYGSILLLMAVIIPLLLRRERFDRTGVEPLLPYLAASAAPVYIQILIV